jgi:pilus assembly protein CpaC
MQIFVRALRENGLLRVLAEPNLVSISGEEATFLAGGSFPVPVPEDDDNISIEFREFGVRLRFTPAVLSEGRIRLAVTPEISEPDFSTAVQVNGFVVPGLVERRVQTVVECGSGQTLAIGGLLSERTRGVTERVPGLGDLPILGPLFSSVEYQQEETELLILVTPELVGAISPQQVTYVPGAQHVAPNDFELFLMGKLEGDNTERAPHLSPRVNRAYPSGPPEEQYGAAATMKLRGPIGPTGSGEGS